VFEVTQALADAAARGEPSKAEDPRDGQFVFLMELHAMIPPLLQKYEAMARQSFDAHEAAVQQTLGPRPVASPPAQG